MTTKPTYTPAIRFPDFLNDGEWEDYSIEEVFDIRNGYTPSKSKAEYWENGTIPWFRMEDIRANGNILSDSIQHITPEAIKGFGLFPAYSIIVATSATIGEHALITVESLANQRFTYLSKKKSFDERVDMMYFHYYMFVIDEWCKKNTNTGGFLSVNMSAFRQLRIPIPPLAEQRRIAASLSALDEMLAATNGKLEQLNAYKKGLMQQLFANPRCKPMIIHGLQIPKLRFPEFKNNKEWEEKKLGEVGEFYKGKGIPKAAASDKGKTPCLRYGELYTHYNEVIEEIQSFTDIPIDELFLSKANDVIIPSSGETKEDISTASCVLKDNVALGGDINVIRTTQNGVFLSYYLNNAKKDDIAKIAQGVSIIHLYNDQLKNLKINIPSLPEQRKIASCLSTMDDQINAYTEKFTLLGQYKKGLMQRMFPQNQMN